MPRRSAWAPQCSTRAISGPIFAIIPCSTHSTLNFRRGEVIQPEIPADFPVSKQLSLFGKQFPPLGNNPTLKEDNSARFLLHFLKNCQSKALNSLPTAPGHKFSR